MRLLRQSVALLLNVLLLQLSVLGGGAACAAPMADTGRAARHAVSPEPGAHHGGRAAEHDAHDAHGGEADGPASGSRELPHCGLAAGCLAPALASRSEPLTATTPAAGRARVTHDGAPRSAVAAPEPPPPRA